MNYMKSKLIEVYNNNYISLDREREREKVSE